MRTIKHNRLSYKIYAFCGTLIALTLFAGCTAIVQNSSDSSGDTAEKTGTGKTSVSFVCTGMARTVLPSPDLSRYTYTVTGILAGGSTETLLEKKIYTELTAAGAVSVDPGSWTFTVSAYSGSTEALAGSVPADLTAGAKTLAVTLYAVTGGAGSVNITLEFPHGKGVKTVKAALYGSPVATDGGTGQTITTGTDNDSVTFTAEGVPSATAKFVRFFLYDTQNVCIGSYTDSVYVVSGLTSTATDTIAAVNMFSVTVNILKDGAAWTDSGRTVTLKKDTLSYDLTNATGSNAATGSVPVGMYDVYVDGTGTGTTLTAATDGTGQSDVDYYTVTIPTVTGCTIAAADGSESPLLRGKNYLFTVTLDANYSNSNNVVVTTNTNTLTATNSTYTISSIMAAQTVAVSGVTGNTYAVTLDNQNADSAHQGTLAVYEKYADGFYLESGCTTRMTTSTNAVTVPERTGYTFAGYYTAADGGGTKYIGADGHITGSAVPANFSASDTTKTLYAKWTANVYSVTLDSVLYDSSGSSYNAGVTNSPTTTIYEKYADGFYLDSTSATRITTDTHVVTIPAKSGYTFAGYYTEKSGSGTQYISASGYLISGASATTFTAAGTLYAKWTLNDVSSLKAVSSNEKITLNWTNPDAVGFSKAVVTWTTAADTSTQLGTQDISGTAGASASYTVTNLTNGTSYMFTVTANDSAGNTSSGVTVTAMPFVTGNSYGTGAPTINAGIPDHLYTSSMAAGTTGYIGALVSGETSCQWYTSTDNSNWSTSGSCSSTNLASINKYITIGKSGTVVYYCFGITNATGTTYSQSCTVECGTAETGKIGYIYYTDGTTSSTYDSNETPAGIVCDVNTDGTVKTIVALTESTTNSVRDTFTWASLGTTGCSTNFNTSLSDGHSNWSTITAADSSAAANASTYYPAFNYCNTYSVTNTDDWSKIWYLPSRDELTSVYFNKVSIAQTLTMLSGSITVNDLAADSYYWTSSQYISGTNADAWTIYFSSGYCIGSDKTVSYNVRCVTNP